MVLFKARRSYGSSTTCYYCRSREREKCHLIRLRCTQLSGTPLITATFKGKWWFTAWTNFPIIKGFERHIVKGNRKFVLITSHPKHVGPGETCKAVLKTDKTTRSINLIVNVPHRKASISALRVRCNGRSHTRTHARTGETSKSSTTYSAIKTTTALLSCHIIYQTSQHGIYPQELGRIILCPIVSETYTRVWYTSYIYTHRRVLQYK